MATAPKVPHDAFVDKIVGDPKQPPDTLMLSGYIGNSSDDGHTRLYFDPQLSSYVEIPDAAILHRQEMGSSPLGGSHVWIQRDATLIHGPIGPNRRKAAFLEGPLTAAMAPEGIATLPPALCTIALPQCGNATHAGPLCGHLTALPVVCHPTTPAAGCHPTLPPQCHPTLPPQCHPTLPPACHPTTPQMHCPPITHNAHCPTVANPACFPTELGPHCGGHTQVSTHCPTNVIPCPQGMVAGLGPTLIPQQCIPHTKFGPPCLPVTLTGNACHATLIGPACHHTLVGPACVHPTLAGPHCPVHTLTGPACLHTLSGPGCVQPTLAGPHCPVHTLLGCPTQLNCPTLGGCPTHLACPTIPACPTFGACPSIACHPGGGLPGAGG